ncbi:MAG: hypothetical protein KME26_08855 [Oscillatoria princeps RMCB-10]|nr:hypothetical protein [Oscillatoria princeps RMCB-10]
MKNLAQNSGLGIRDGGKAGVRDRKALALSVHGDFWQNPVEMGLKYPESFLGCRLEMSGESG